MTDGFMEPGIQTSPQTIVTGKDVAKLMRELIDELTRIAGSLRREPDGISLLTRLRIWAIQDYWRWKSRVGLKINGSPKRRMQKSYHLQYEAISNFRRKAHPTSWPSRLVSLLGDLRLLQRSQGPPLESTSASEPPGPRRGRGDAVGIEALALPFALSMDSSPW